MSWQLLLIMVVVMLAMLGFGIGSYVAHIQERRRHALRYHQHRDVPPPSTVCPKCRRRSYSRSDVANSYCRPCDHHYGASAPSGTMRVSAS